MAAPWILMGRRQLASLLFSLLAVTAAEAKPNIAVTPEKSSGMSLIPGGDVTLPFDEQELPSHEQLIQNTPPQGTMKARMDN